MQELCLRHLPYIPAQIEYINICEASYTQQVAETQRLEAHQDEGFVISQS